LRILVTGAGGLLGSAVVSLASRRHEVYSTYNVHPSYSGTPVRLDLLNRNEISREVRRIAPEAIVHLAALTDVDACERNKALAESINHEATRALSESAKEGGTFFLYVSTDYVFDGSKGMYKEDDPANPINTYGMTKLKGEEAVRSSGGEFCIARGSVIYGPRPAAGKVNFALWILERLRRRENANILVDQYVSPTLSTSMAASLIEIVERRLTGVFHVSGAERVSRLNFAMALAKTFDLDPSVLRPIPMSEMKWLAKRPRDSSLDVRKADRTLDSKPLSLGESLRRLKTEVGG